MTSREGVIAGPRLGLVQDPSVEVVDSKASSTGIKAWVERVHGRD